MAQECQMPILPLRSPRARERGARCLCRDSVNHRRAAAAAPRFRLDPPLRTSPKDRDVPGGAGVVIRFSSASRLAFLGSGGHHNPALRPRGDQAVLRREPLGLGASSSSAAASSRPRRGAACAGTALTTVNRPCKNSKTRPPSPHPWPLALPATPAKRRARYTNAGFRGSPQRGVRSVRPTARALRSKNPRS